MNISNYLTTLLKSLIWILKKIAAMIGSIILLMLGGAYVLFTFIKELLLILIPVYGIITPSVIALITKRNFYDTIKNYYGTLMTIIIRLKSFGNSSHKISSLIYKENISWSYPKWSIYLLITLLLFLTLLLALRIFGIPESLSPKKRIIAVTQIILKKIVTLWKL